MKLIKYTSLIPANRDNGFLWIPYEGHTEGKEDSKIIFFKDFFDKFKYESESKEKLFNKCYQIN